jgi:ribosome-interacting GTPase 1
MKIEDQIRAIEAEIRATPYNKATSHHVGRLKAKLAKLREAQQSRSAKKGKKTGIRKSGDAMVVLIGPIGCGKSTLLNLMTGARAKDDPYDLTITPGVLVHLGARIQILDVPDILMARSGDAITVIRDADMIVFVMSPSAMDPRPYIDELYSHGIRINQKPPDVQIRRTTGGGININSTVDPGIDRQSIEGILREYRIHSADIIIRETLTPERFIDGLESNRRYLRVMGVMNKADLINSDKVPSGIVAVSAKTGAGLEQLRGEIFKRLELMRIYMKPRGGQADRSEPMILQEGSTVAHLCDKIHRDFRNNFRYATVMGSSAKHDSQRVGLDHTLADEDVVTIIIQK